MVEPDQKDQQLLLEKIYGIQFPPDFFAFWRFATDNDALLRSTNIELGLVGPFDILRDPASGQNDDPVREARYYNDPPEFLTIATGHTDGLHWGYYLDDPVKPPFPIVQYYSNDAFELSIVGATMFEVLRFQIELFHRDDTEYMAEEPEEYRDVYQTNLDRLARLREALQMYETGDRPEVGEEYVDKYSPTEYIRQVAAKTRDGMGIVVSADKYRPLTGEDMFQRWDFTPTTENIEPLAQEAMDLLEQGYPGAALKLGKDLWIFEDFRQLSYNLLDATYSALNRPLLQKYLKLAISYREECDSKNA
ncbi:hypothetical protein FQN54_005892 [Arachnomyces sp. PD_36]|nr:hypothetical protein FQN54_005892 [Arachnomyces sp. PD_36]